jgi:hypothetical protein
MSSITPESGSLCVYMPLGSRRKQNRELDVSGTVACDGGTVTNPITLSGNLCVYMYAIGIKEKTKQNWMLAVPSPVTEGTVT